jgi:hypothetical protein
MKAAIVVLADPKPGTEEAWPGLQCFVDSL